MRAEKLAMMANQIATFFDAQGEAGAPEAVADHLRKFWDPVMRAELEALAGRGDGALKPTVVKAVALLGPRP
jgi:formate dehydrogenase subunit delta